ncbi:HAD family hydrolase [Rhizohabitans arisaemae]|uniref:HAD family hydrolase n=1 Tax=Rhizohabitans arisaemae TaxID=2720610 RepID=UPI0024B20FF8|nr:HAD-IA family hydrolase [Rhizohabitans arisaemae]
MEIPREVADDPDPLSVFRFSAMFGESVSALVNKALTEFEVSATESATPTPGAAELIRQLKESGRSLAVVSNNSEQAVKAYLQANELTPYFDYVAGRVSSDPDLMKPNPHLVHRAMTALQADAASTALIGDSESDMTVSKTAGILALGYANRPEKLTRLHAAGASYIVKPCRSWQSDNAVAGYGWHNALP